MQKYFFLLLGLLFSQISLAKIPVDSMIAVCSPYPNIEDKTSAPLHFNSTNNLARPAESAFYEAEGEKIIIYGRVMDNNCTPLSDAKIYIWQNNKAGYIQYPLKNPSKNYKTPKWVDPNFTGTGITNSDNLGRFNFTSIKPGAHNKITPHINIMIEHPKLKTLISKIYFPSKKIIHDINNEGLPFTMKNSSDVKQISAVAGEKNGVYLIDITIDGEISNKSY